MFAANLSAAPLANSLYVEDVFSAYTYAGTGSAQTIANGVALADSPVTQAFNAFAFKSTGDATQKISVGFDMSAGSLLWLKDRSGVNSHILTDTVRGANNYLRSNATNASAAMSGALFNSDGFTTVPTTVGPNTNMIAWCFAKKAKFMDIVTWTGDGTSSKTIAHALGGASPGMIVVKRTDAASNWETWHRSFNGGVGGGRLNLTSAFDAGLGFWSNVTASSFDINANAGVNASGGTYVAYIFAHDSASDGLIQCGSFTTDGSGNATVNLGWKPQWLLTKRTGAAEDWRIVDTTRAWPDSGSQAVIRPNLSDAEQNQNININPTSTGFGVALGATAGAAYIYMAIRAPETSSTGGGMVWGKQRDGGFNYAHVLTDTVRGKPYLKSNTTDAQTTETVPPLSGFNGNGFNLAAPTSSGALNSAGVNYVSWCFKRAPKFFDVVQYTGNGVAGRTIAHSLGQTPGMMIVKSADAATNGGADGYWFVYHRGLSTPESGAVFLNTTDARNGTATWGNTLPTSTGFTVDSGSLTNITGRNYIAYLFAHDTSTDGLIQCGSFTTDGSGFASVNLGWEPQFVLMKRTDGAADWFMFDSMRGMTVGGNDTVLNPNLSNAEGFYTGNYIEPTATGFNRQNTANQTFIYLAIRRGPMRKPTSGAQVYNAIARTGNAAGGTSFTGVGFSPDCAIIINRDRAASNANGMYDRLRGNVYISTNSTSPESVTDTVQSFNNDGLTLSGSTIVNAAYPYINWLFRRYPGVFDVVCFKGNSTAQTVPHNLTVIPELIIVKDRSAVRDWPVYHAALGAGKNLYLDVTNAQATSTTMWNNTAPTASVFSVGSNSDSNTSGSNLVAYLFATLAGISKVGSYGGNGASQTIDCGFAAGARFVLIKRTDAAGDWLCFDTVRGIVAANDPVLSLQSTSAEFTGADYIDPSATGFDVVHSAVNTNGATYIYLALA